MPNNLYHLHKVEFFNFKGLSKISDQNGCFVFEAHIGLNLISGENGTGKSTILNNLSPFVESLDNTTLTTKNFIFPNGGKNVYFNLDGAEYKSVIKFSESLETKAWLYHLVDSEWLIVPGFESGKQTTYKDKISHLLSISPDRVSKTLHIKQNSDFIINAKPKERLSLIQELMPDTNHIDSKIEVFKQLEIENKTNLSKKQGSLETLDNQISKLDTSIKTSVLESTKNDILNFKTNVFDANLNIINELSSQNNSLSQTIKSLIQNDDFIDTDIDSPLRLLDLIPVHKSSSSIDELYDLKNNLESDLKNIETLQKDADFLPSFQKHIDTKPCELKIEVLKKNISESNELLSKYKLVNKNVELEKSWNSSIDNSIQNSGFSSLDEYSNVDKNEVLNFLSKRQVFLDTIKSWEKFQADSKLKDVSQQNAVLLFSQFIKSIFSFENKNISFPSVQTIVDDMKQFITEFDNTVNGSNCVDGIMITKDDYLEAVVKMKFNSFGFVSVNDWNKFSNEVDEKLTLIKNIKNNELFDVKWFFDTNISTILTELDISTQQLEKLQQELSSSLQQNAVFNSELPKIDNSVLAKEKLINSRTSDEIKIDLHNIDKAIKNIIFTQKQLKSNETRTIVNDKITVFLDNEIKISNTTSSLFDKITVFDLSIGADFDTSASSDLNDTYIKFNNLISSLDNKIFNTKITEKLIKEQSDTKLKILELQNNYRVANKIKIALGKVKESLASNFMTKLTDDANDYLNSDDTSSIVMNLSIEQKGSSFTIFSIQPDLEKQEISTLSGAEKSVVQRALSLALSNADNNNLYRLITLDEADSALSESNKSSFVKSIDKINSLFGQTFLISHSEYVKNSFPLSNVIKLEKN